MYQPTMDKVGINKGHERAQRNLSPDASRVKDEEGASRMISLLTCSFVICQKLSQQFYKDIFKMGHSIAQAYYSTEKKVPRGREKPFPKVCAEAQAERAAE